MRVLVTGVAGFIGYHVAERLLALGHSVVGIDSVNDYYDPRLKELRLRRLLALQGEFRFHRGSFAEATTVEELFQDGPFDVIVHLGAQAGVRYSIENPHAYVTSNVTGTLNILEACRRHGVGHLVYASSSSVYGANRKVPFAVSDKTDQPVSLYAATKKSNELMCAAYTDLYKFRATGLRFFTVYGPFGRPDMAYFKFAKAILEGAPLQLYNGGDMRRDFTYIDDIVDGIMAVVDGAGRGDLHRVYNLGNSRPEQLMNMVHTLEALLGKQARLELLPMQMGDVHETYADIASSTEELGYVPKTALDEGLAKFASWYVAYAPQRT